MNTDALKATVWRWKLTAITMMVITAGAMAISARADLQYPERLRARTVEAQEIVLKDEVGQVRARFAVRGNAAQLVIYDAEGKAVAVLPAQPRMKELGN